MSHEILDVRVGKSGMPIAIGLLALTAGTLSGCGRTDPQMPECRRIVPVEASGCGVAAGGCAPESQRIDLCQPTFTNPTQVTNLLFPISNQHSYLALGTADGELFRAEVTLLPTTRTMAWDGGQIAVLESQYAAFSDGRLHEMALDRYAQADDGSVWYLGEDVFNFEDGVLADTAGTWLAGRDGPIAMIMPAQPRVGDVYRPENAPGTVFEEVTIRQVGLAVDGPSGLVSGAIVAEELHMDGSREEKVFAPGYGEFRTGGGGDVEAVALSVPTDALSGPLPAALLSLSADADAIFDLAGSRNWAAASSAVRRMDADWRSYRGAGGVPALLDAQMTDALGALADAVDAKKREEARQEAIDAFRAALDLQLRHRRPAEIDTARFDLWARQVLVDAANNEPSAVKGDATTLEFVRARFAHIFDAADVARLDADLRELRTAADAEDLAAATEAARQLRSTLAGLRPVR